MSVAAFTLGCMATFAVTMVHGPHWDRSRPIRGQDGWNEHAAFMDGLVDDGLIILGGPLGDGQQGALLLAEAAGEREIAARPRPGSVGRHGTAARRDRSVLGPVAGQQVPRPPVLTGLALLRST